MASRTLTPLRAVSRRLRAPINSSDRVQFPSRTLFSASKPKTSNVPPPPASKSASASTTTTSSASTSKPTPATASKPTPTSGTRTPIPAVSGTPLPNAPGTTQAYPSPSSSSQTDIDTNGNGPIDWTQSYHGLGTSAFPIETSAILQARLDPEDIEVKPDGIIYLPEIKYRRILNAAFGPGGWGLAPRGQLTVQEKLVTREYALVVHGRFVAQARGEQQYFSEDGVSTAAEGCKSNALMRCCKDLGIASELWDPRFIRKFMKEYAVQQWVEHVTTKKKKQIWLRKDDEIRYPWKKS
ncbi:Mgm101p-domain-containing protein [Hypoxylon trugodes]|uniref:Mgm101p-domain-containing protein n=1 Tax=Hypoxylon trugodes TaxID=326681 RepID=UPI00218E612D|nr:Mgm101p-domain-containing protein [Hypoxylon trugodes]KAI1387297.1 Mgm101p-domain-containing protein [Hypoxylon trugodes]